MTTIQSGGYIAVVKAHHTDDGNVILSRPVPFGSGKTVKRHQQQLKGVSKETDLLIMYSVTAGKATMLSYSIYDPKDIFAVALNVENNGCGDIGRAICDVLESETFANYGIQVNRQDIINAVCNFASRSESFIAFDLVNFDIIDQFVVDLCEAGIEPGCIEVVNHTNIRYQTIDNTLMPFIQSNLSRNNIEFIGDYYVSQKGRFILSQVEQCLINGGNMFVLIHGETGNGKTAFVRNAAAYFGVERYFVPCQYIAYASMLVGKDKAEDATTYYKFSDFSDKVFEETDEPLIVHFDELNRSPQDVMALIMSLTDDSRSALIDGHLFTIHRPIIWMATVNIGGQYTGTETIDMAIINRATHYYMIERLSDANLVGVLQTRYSEHPNFSNEIVEQTMEAVRFARETFEDTHRMRSLNLGNLIAIKIIEKLLNGGEPSETMIALFLDHPSVTKAERMTIAQELRTHYTIFTSF